MFYVLLILVQSLTYSSERHDFHLSKTDIHYKSEQQALQITVHSFIDDTEEALQPSMEEELKLMTNSEHEKADSLLAAYLSENIVIKIDGVEQACQYLGKEASDDIQGVYCYLEILNVSAFATLEVDNSILIDIFQDQKNIVNIKADNKPKAFHILTASDTYKKIDF